MEWTIGIALLPMLLCGIMMFGGMILAGLGLKRATDRTAQPDRPGHPADEATTGREPLDVGAGR